MKKFVILGLIVLNRFLLPYLIHVIWLIHHIRLVHVSDRFASLLPTFTMWWCPLATRATFGNALLLLSIYHGLVRTSRALFIFQTTLLIAIIQIIIEIHLVSSIFTIVLLVLVINLRLKYLLIVHIQYCRLAYFFTQTWRVHS